MCPFSGFRFPVPVRMRTSPNCVDAAFGGKPPPFTAHAQLWCMRAVVYCVDAVWGGSCSHKMCYTSLCLDAAVLVRRKQCRSLVGPCLYVVSPCGLIRCFFSLCVAIEIQIWYHLMGPYAMCVTYFIAHVVQRAGFIRSFLGVSLQSLATQWLCTGRTGAVEDREVW